MLILSFRGEIQHTIRHTENRERRNVIDRILLAITITFQESTKELHFSEEDRYHLWAQNHLIWMTSFFHRSPISYPQRQNLHPVHFLQPRSFLFLSRQIRWRLLFKGLGRSKSFYRLPAFFGFFGNFPIFDLHKGQNIEKLTCL